MALQHTDWSIPNKWSESWWTWSSVRVGSCCHASSRADNHPPVLYSFKNVSSWAYAIPHWFKCPSIMFLKSLQVSLAPFHVTLDEMAVWVTGPLHPLGSEPASHCKELKSILLWCSMLSRSRCISLSLCGACGPEKAYRTFGESQKDPPLQWRIMDGSWGPPSLRLHCRTNGYWHSRNSFRLRCHFVMNGCPPHLRLFAHVMMVNVAGFTFAIRRRFPYCDIGIIAEGTDIIRLSKECQTFKVLLNWSTRFMECCEQCIWYFKNLPEFLGSLGLGLASLMIEGRVANMGWIRRWFPLRSKFPIEIR